MKNQELVERKGDEKLIERGAYTREEVNTMRKQNKKGCIFHGEKNITDCYHCGLYNDGDDE